MKANILVIEDEKDIRDLISFQLKSKGHEIIGVDRAEDAVSLIENNHPIDLFIVDWMLPGQISGLDFIKSVKNYEKYKETPIIMITALTQPENIVAGLDAGANDYISKPFDLKVLEARVRVQLRDPSPQNKELFEFGELKIEIAKCKVYVSDIEINLTSTEFKILQLLTSKPGHVFTREQLINSILGEQVFVTGRTIDTHIAGLRKKMAATSDYIETIRGIGYRFKDAL
ncbi:MAG TPA: response regulator [Bacteriovoracaceae bacterium]|nr:response regulator [Bacteriovoracaceae bacterium]